MEEKPSSQILPILSQTECPCEYMIKTIVIGCLAMREDIGN